MNFNPNTVMIDLEDVFKEDVQDRIIPDLTPETFELLRYAFYRGAYAVAGSVVFQDEERDPSDIILEVDLLRDECLDALASMDNSGIRHPSDFHDEDEDE